VKNDEALLGTRMSHWLMVLMGRVLINGICLVFLKIRQGEYNGTGRSHVMEF
jgi:hypothetical protein